jgi:small-conductance mechanosensitive channel
MDGIQQFLDRIYFGNDLRAWGGALLLFALLFTLLPLARVAIAKRIRSRSVGQPVAALELTLALLGSTTRLFLVAVAAWIALRGLEVPEAFDRGFVIALQLVIWLQVGLWGTTLVRRLMEPKRALAPAPAGAASLNILRFIAVAAIWVFALLLPLANLGIEIMPLVAGLGIGGIAIALAVQNVLGDLLASLSIALDKPFKVGDFLVVGDEKGTVEHIGIKSTRLRSLSGEQVVFANNDLLNSRVHNYGLLYERRIVFRIGIVYETPRELVAEVPRILEAAIRAQQDTRFDRAHFASYGNFSLDYEAVYYVLDAAYNKYMDVQQAINLHVFDEFARRGIEFAYPTAKHLNVQLPAPPAAD